jgi:hypothetical protein
MIVMNKYATRKHLCPHKLDIPHNTNKKLGVTVVSTGRKDWYRFRGPLLQGGGGGEAASERRRRRHGPEDKGGQVVGRG